MSTSVTLNEQSVVCRTCLKVLDTTGFTYIDDENGYVKNVGSIREMLQFCIPELDLYVSTQPAICYQCLTILVQVYNFKIKCLNGENTIKAYITRNNLQDYNQVNLNCVLMDDLRLKSQKIKIENRIKHMMLKEIPDNDETIIDQSQHSSESQQIINRISHEEAMGGYNIILADPSSATELQDNDNGQEEPNGKEMKIEISETDDTLIADSGSQINHNELDAPDSLEEEEEEEENYFDETVNNESNNEKHMLNIVAVRKDLFDNQNSQSSVEELSKDQPALILNNGIVPQNGRIVIKIDRKKLRSLSITNEHKPSSSNISEPSEENKPGASPPPLTALEVSTSAISPSSEESCTPKIVSVESVEPSSEKETVYNCNRCNFVTSDVIKMYDHNRTHHVFDYTCQHCPFSTSKVELLGKHMTMVHPQSLVTHKNAQFKVTENYACTLCPFSVKSIDLLRSHHLSAHGNADSIKGPIVLNSAFTEGLSRNDLRILKRLEYTCDVCPYSTRDKSNLRKHLFTHGTKPLKCEHCTYKCVSPYQLRRHQKQKHAKHAETRPRNQPYKLPDFNKEKIEAMDSFKVTLESIKREIEKELST